MAPRWYGDSARSAHARARAEARTRRKRLAENAQDHALRTRVRDRLKPTAETEAKLRPDPIARMHDRGTIGDDERDAALEIRAVFEAVCGSLLSRSAWPDGRQPGRSGGMAETIARLHADHYVPWARKCGQKPPMLEVAIDIIVDGLSCKAVDRARRRRDGWASQVVKDALSLYVGAQEGRLQHLDARAA